MTNYTTLGKIAAYSTKRVPINTVTIDNYVTVDNLLQNKQGVVTASGMPSISGQVPGYDAGNILVGNIRPYLKKIWFANRSGGASADVLVLSVKEGHSSRYVYYSMFLDDFFAHMMRGKKGTKMPRGDKRQVLEYAIAVNELPAQEKIAAVLSSLDNKIGLNNRINTELEAMIKTLYEYWFVQYDFPDVDGKPYRSSGGKMVYSEILKREIPEGWEAGELQEIANITMGQSPPGNSYNDVGVGTIFFQGATDFGARFPSVREYTTQPSRLAKKGDILMSVRAPVGTLNISGTDCCIGRGLAALSSKDSCITYLYWIMQNFKQVFDRRNGSGTTFGSITKDDLFTLPVVKPHRNVLDDFSKLTTPLFLKQNQNEVESQKLADLRDWLLPMLMNGQVTVK
jgi:type I restriction enzyme S subunit